MTGQHCPGCRDGGPEGTAPCQGLGAPQIGAFRISFHHHLPRLPWPARIKVLLGLPVCMDIDLDSGQGRFADVTDLMSDGIGPDDLLGPGGPWRDQT